jgi:DNA transformation protein
VKLDRRTHADGPGVEGRTFLSSLIELPNLGKVVVAQLEAAGISSPAQLKRAGSINAALRLAANGVSVCASKLCALEGAIRGVRWHSIPAAERAALVELFESRLQRKA